MASVQGVVARHIQALHAKQPPVSTCTPLFTSTESKPVTASSKQDTTSKQHPSLTGWCDLVIGQVCCFGGTSEKATTPIVSNQEKLRVPFGFCSGLSLSGLGSTSGRGGPTSVKLTATLSKTNGELHPSPKLVIRCSSLCRCGVNLLLIGKAICPSLSRQTIGMARLISEMAAHLSALRALF